ncbi:MAG: LPS-assembly protein LptD, partial [Elusimicrobia bacterium]|nr:LPS-assembly protein LptD [Elusimicrobiota bacterium]
YEGSTTGADAQIMLKGGVTLQGTTWTLRADQARVDMQTHRARAKGGFELDDGYSVLRGQEGEFDLTDRTGWVGSVRTEYHPWYVWAKRGTLDARQKARFRDAVFTSCNDDPPHYFFRATELNVTPRKYLTAYNVRFYLGDVPLFYSPFLWKSLRKEHFVHTRVMPGYDKRNGVSLRSNTLFGLGPWIRGKLFLDGYTHEGFAAGSELVTKRSEDSRGALYGYWVRKDESGRMRWTVLGSGYQALGSTYAAQGRLQAQSDPDFNNNYVRSNAFRVTPELFNSAALVRRTKWTTTRLTYSRHDVSASSGTRFQRAQESTPRLEWQTAQLSLRKLPVLFDFNAFADDNYDVARGFTQRSVGTGVEATQTLDIHRGVSLTPRAAYREVYESRREAYTTALTSAVYQDVFTGYYDLGTNLRLDSPVGAWDLGYLFTRRLKPDTLEGDYGAPDYGVESSLLSVTDAIRPSRRWLARFGSGYDYRPDRLTAPGFRGRVQPFTTDLTYFAPRGIELSLRDDYQLDRGNRAFLFQGDWGERDGTFASVGLQHDIDQADAYYLATEAGWAPKKSLWVFSGALRHLVRTPGGVDLHGYQLFEKELQVSRDFHDFHTHALFRLRPGGVKEALFNVELRFRPAPPRRTKAVDWEKEWFPWRGKKQDDQE